MNFLVNVSDHAAARARQRFPGFDPHTIPAEVNSAMEAGRWSPRKPNGIQPPDDPTCFYVWAPGGERVHAVALDAITGACFVVKTTMRAELEMKEAA